MLQYLSRIFSSRLLDLLQTGEADDRCPDPCKDWWRVCTPSVETDEDLEDKDSLEDELIPEQVELLDLNAEVELPRTISGDGSFSSKCGFDFN